MITCPVCGKEEGVKPVIDDKGNPVFTRFQTYPKEIVKTIPIGIGGAGIAAAVKACVGCGYIMVFYNYEASNKKRGK